MKISLLISSIILSIIVFGQTNQQAKSAYDFMNPTGISHLPKILHEVSGLTDIDATTIACIQDELGLIFIYDLKKQKIIKQFTFGKPGDYEGITYTGKELFILRSDGMLIDCQFTMDSYDVKIDTFETHIPAKDNEGLCFDKANNRLLIGCKSKIGKGKEFKNIRAIYGFDLNTKKRSKEPVFTSNLPSIIDFAKKNKIELPTRLNKKTKEEVVKLKIGISAIAIHPLTSELFVLSAVDHLLIIYGKEGILTDLIVLDTTLYQKAEGITFFDNGDLLISNEGKNATPTLLKMNYRK